MHELTALDARRLALCRAGLLKPAWTGMPRSARGRGATARAACHAVITRFGYLQLDTVSVAGARSHALVLASRLDGLTPELGEELLQPGEPLFEYWGHEASWLPHELYPACVWRQEATRDRPWYRASVAEHGALAERLLKRLRDDGPLQSSDLDGERLGNWWDFKAAKQVMIGLWSTGQVAIRERVKFRRVFDLPERVIPADLRARALPREDAYRVLLLKALDGHGWATAQTLGATWRLRGRSGPATRVLEELREDGHVVPCDVVLTDGTRRGGWVRPDDLELAARLRRVRPRDDRGVLLSPFDPVLWDRDRLERLFGFFQRIEIYTPAAKRRFGYFCLPVLAGDQLVARVDLKADRANGCLQVLSRHFEDGHDKQPAGSAAREATRTAIARYAAQLGLDVAG